MNSGPLHSTSISDTSDVRPAEIAAEAVPNTAFTRRLIVPALKYLEGRSLLLGIEAREALQHGVNMFAWLMVGAVALFAGWLLLATSLVGVLTLYLDWSWVKATAVAGVAHILVALIAALLAWKRLTTARWFSDTLNELQNDRVWLQKKTTQN